MAEITVLMPVYNSASTMAAAIKSILSQTFTDFEFLIIDDGSTDKSVEIIKSFDDTRIRLVQNPQNLKLIKTLNKGIGLVETPWIARMDSDDVSEPTRLEKQIRFLRNNPQFIACGTWATVIDINGEKRGVLRKPLGEEFSSWAWIPTPVIHPTLVIKTEVLKNNLFSEDALHCEDYELWMRLTKQGFKISNLPERLLKYRVHSNSVSEKFRNLQLDTSYSVFQKYYSYAGISKDDYFALLGVGGKKLSYLDRLKLIEKIINGRSLPFRMYAYSLLKTLKQGGKHG